MDLDTLHVASTSKTTEDAPLPFPVFPLPVIVPASSGNRVSSKVSPSKGLTIINPASFATVD